VEFASGAERSSADTRDGRRGRLAGRAVLVVDDAPYLREALVLLLESEGAAVVATGSGREALELALRQPFDLVLTDLRLPDVGGDVLLGKLADVPRRPQAVVITGAVGDDTSVRIAGAAAVFPKPLEWEALLEELVRLTAQPSQPASGHR
jgi:two-component system response regulator PilR (NtrC family)